MIILYTALGRFEMKRNINGKQYPVVVFNGKEYLLEIHEMLVWSSLAWAIHTPEELRAIYNEKAAEAGIIADTLFGESLNNLKSHGLIVSGQDYTGADALYNLLSRMRLVPVKEKMITKVLAFLHLTFIKGVAFKKTKKIFTNGELTQGETAVLKLIRASQYTAAGLIAYIQHDKLTLNENNILDAVYESADSSCDGINKYVNRPLAHHNILQVVANLYLKKLILFDRA